MPSQMRRLLDFLYDSAAALAALFMVGLLGMVLLSIISRQLHFHVPGHHGLVGEDAAHGVGAEGVAEDR